MSPADLKPPLPSPRYKRRGDSQWRPVESMASRLPSPFTSPRLMAAEWSPESANSRKRSKPRNGTGDVACRAGLVEVVLAGSDGAAGRVAPVLGKLAVVTVNDPVSSTIR